MSIEEKRQQILEKLPISVRTKAANEYVADSETVHRLTKTDLWNVREQRIAYMAFLAGFDRAAESGYSELLEENKTLQSERFDLTADEKRQAGLSRMLTEVMLHVCDHRDCKCRLCEAVKTLDD